MTVPERSAVLRIGATTGPKRSIDCMMGRCQVCWGYINPVVNWRGDVPCGCDCHAGDGNAPDWARAQERADEVLRNGTHATAASP